MYSLMMFFRIICMTFLTAAVATVLWPNEVSFRRDLSVQISSGVFCDEPLGRLNLTLGLVNATCMNGVMTDWNRTQECDLLFVRVWEDPQCLGTAQMMWHFDNCNQSELDQPFQPHSCLIGFQHVIKLNHTLMPLSATVKEVRSSLLPSIVFFAMMLVMGMVWNAVLNPRSESIQ